MIITPTRPSAGAAVPPDWSALARKGMLWSEVQVVDVSRLEPGGEGLSTDPDCVEAVFCSRGIATFDHGDTPAVTLLAGQLLLIRPAQRPVRAIAGRNGAELVRLRVLPPEVAKTLPERFPSLDAPPPATAGDAAA